MASANKGRRTTGPRQALILVLVFASLWIGLGSQLVREARTTDFLNLYTGASFALDWDWHHIYTEAGQLARERRFVPERTVLWPFVRPPVYAIIIAPLALMPFAPAFWFWMSAQCAVLVCCLVWAWKRFGPEAAVWGALFIEAPLGIAHAQDCALFLALVCGAFVLGEKKRMFLCGLVLGLGLTKFHLFLLWPLVLLVQRRWRMLEGFAVCGFVQGLLSLAILGWSGMWGYAGFILHLGQYYAPKGYLNINAILLNIGISSRPLLAVLTALVVGLVLWSSRRTGPLWMTFTLATAGSLLISPHVYYYDGSMLLLPAWCVMFLSDFPIARLAAAFICTPIVAFASIYSHPLSCLMAVAMLIFLVGVCLESEFAARRLPRAEPKRRADLDDPARCVQT